MLLSDVGRQTVGGDLIAAESTERFAWRDEDALHGFLPQRIPSWLISYWRVTRPSRDLPECKPTKVSRALRLRSGLAPSTSLRAGERARLRATRFGAAGRAGSVRAKPVERSERSEASEPRERSETCLSALHRRRVSRVSVLGVWGQRPQIYIWRGRRDSNPRPLA